MAKTGRPKTGAEQYNVRLTKKQYSTLQSIAKTLGYTFNAGSGDVGSISLLCQAIADGDIVLVKVDR